MSLARALIEAEDPKHFLKKVAVRSDWVVAAKGCTTPTTLYWVGDDRWSMNFADAHQMDIQEFAGFSEDEYSLNNDFVNDLVQQGVQAIGLVSAKRDAVDEWIYIQEADGWDTLLNLIFPERARMMKAAEDDLQRMNDEHGLGEAENAKMALRQAKTGWQVKPIPNTDWQVTLWFNGEEVHNMSINGHDMGANNSPENAQALADYLNWLETVLPWSDREGWVPNSWLGRADAQLLPERYMKETGKPAFKKEMKTGAVMVWPEELGEAEDPKMFLKRHGPELAIKDLLAKMALDDVPPEDAFQPGQRIRRIRHNVFGARPHGGNPNDIGDLGTIVAFHGRRDEPEHALYTVRWDRHPIGTEYCDHTSVAAVDVAEAEDPKQVFRAASAQENVEYNLREFLTGNEAIRCVVTHVGDMENYWLHIYPMYGADEGFGPFRKDQVQLFRDEWLGFRNTRWEVPAGVFHEAEDPRRVFKQAVGKLEMPSFSPDEELKLKAFIYGHTVTQALVRQHHCGGYWLDVMRSDGTTKTYWGVFDRPTLERIKRWPAFAHAEWLGEAENPKNVFRRAVSKAGGWSQPMRFIRADLTENPDVYAVEMTKSAKGTYVELLKIVIPGEVEIHPFGPFTEEEVQELMQYPTLQLVNWSYRDPIRESEDPKRFLQQYGRDFSYGSDGTIIYVTPLNGAAKHFLSTVMIPGRLLPSDGTYVTQPEYLQQFLAQAGAAGLVGRRVKLEGALLQNFRPLSESGARVYVRFGDVREAEDAKSILRQATAARAQLIHCFKDFHFLRSVPRPEPPGMLMALHALQSKECEMAEQHVFTVLDLQAGYAFHQSARRTDPTHFWTERMWKSVANEPLSDPSFESLVSQIR